MCTLLPKAVFLIPFKGKKELIPSPFLKRVFSTQDLEVLKCGMLRRQTVVLKEKN